MNLTESQTSWAAYALRALICERRLRGQPVAAEIVALHRDLVVSADGISDSADLPPSTRGHESINAADAAQILGVSERRVRQLRADLGGERCPCRHGWVFRRRDVIDYAAAKGCGAEPA